MINHKKCKIMKTIFAYTTILFCVICGCLSSCSDNDSNDINIELLYGSWLYEYDDSYYETYTFSEGGHFELYWEEYDYNGDVIDRGQETGEWNYENGILTFPYEDEIISAQIVSLNQNSLVLGNGSNERMTLYRTNREYQKRSNRK